MKNKLITLAFFLALTTSVSARISASHGIANLRISVVGSNVVLFWPSLTNQAFYVQYVPNLNSTSQWVTLAANLPAALGTNRTSFVHSNSVQYPPPCGTNGGSSFTEPPGFAMTLNTGEKVFVTLEGEVLTKEDLLPYPWNPRFQSKVKAAKAAELSQTGGALALLGEGGGENLTSDPCPSAPTMGFYRVFIPAPLAIGDVFSVAQNSTSNQLSILANDSDPEENLFLLSNVVAAAHGSILYFPDAEFFRYTPSSNYWGLDTFSYVLTNDVGGFAGTNVWVFVNKSGNHNPSAPNLLYTLASNQTQVIFPALTNATDSDGNPLSVVLLFQPAHGLAVTNANGTVTYTADTNRLALDSFTYVIADTNGGMVQRMVRIVPQDSDGDLMPDAWEMKNGLNPVVSDYNGDPDGDGVKNIAEYHLGTSPQATNRPLTLSVVSNAAVQGFVNFPLPGVSPDIANEAITLYVNSLPAGNSFLSQRADGIWQLHWDTLFTTNGTYSIKARFQYSVGGITNTTFGAQTTVVVSNRLWVNPLTRSFTDFVLLDYRLTTNNSSYRIDLYDDFGNPLGYAQGSTTNGRIYLSWDLKNGSGQRIVFGNIKAGIVVSNAVAGTSRPIYLWYTFEHGSLATSFVVAWGWHKYSSSFNNDREQMILGGVVNIVGDPSQFDSYALQPPAFNVPYTRTFRYDNDSDKTALMQAITNSNNFYWLGHGDDQQISGVTNGSSVVTALDVELALENQSFRVSEKKPKTDKHPYKLVILNGCETYSSLWAGAFGVPFSPNGTTNTLFDYQLAGREPRAFVGWTAEGVVPDAGLGSGLSHAQYGEALAYLFYDWMSGLPLYLCMDDFADTATGYGFTNQDKWKISGCENLTRGD